VDCSENLGVNFLKCPKSRCAHELTAAIVSFTNINVSYYIYVVKSQQSLKLRILDYVFYDFFDMPLQKT